MHQALGGARLTLRLLFTVTLIAMPMAVQALGLGRLTVNSGLDEPFNGQIDLISPTAQELKTLKAALASRADFDIAGVERNVILFDITYTVRQHPNGQYYLQLATHNPVREPFLHFLIQVDWSGGHLIREYSALLDPPQWVVGAAAEINVPATSAPEVASVVEAVPVIEAAPVADAAPIEELPPIGTAAEPTAEAVAAEKPQLAVSEPVATAEAPPVATSAEAPAVASQVESAPVQVETSATVEPILPSAAVAASEPEPAVVSELAPSPVAEIPAAASAAEHEFGPVKSGETLYQVAQKVNIDKSLTHQQVMLALLRANPSAFFGGNVNNLKAGKILTVPERETIAAVPKAEAAKEFRAQYDAWQEYKLKLAGAGRAVAVAETETPMVVAKSEAKKDEAKKSEKTAKAAKAGKDKSAASGKAVPVDLLKIVRANLEQDIPEESTKTPGVETKKDAGKEQRALTERVATLEEAIESKQMQNKEMRERVGKLQEQVKNTERLVDLENKDLALAQKQAAEKQAAEAKAAAEKAAQEKLALEKAAQEKLALEKAAQEQAAKDKAAADAAKAAQAAKPVEAPKPAGEAAPAKKPAVAAKPAPAPAVPEEGLLDGILASVMDNPLLLALLGALGVLGAGVGGMYAYRRRRASQEFSESILSSSSLSSEASITDGSGQAAASDTSFLSDFSQGGMGNIHTDEVDPIAEAEVYLAYGRDEQAEEILKDAIVKDPARQELKGKLLEIYFQRNDVAGFETLAEELYAALEGKGGKVWDKAEEMGQKLSPANPMFRGGKPAARASAGPTTMLVDEPSLPPFTRSEDALETMLSTQGLETSPAPAPSGLDFNMNFDAPPSRTREAPAEPSFDMAFDMDTGTAPSAPPAADSASSFDMDFNLGAPEAADTSSNLIDFNTSGTQELTSGLDFSTSDSSPAAGGDVEFSLGGMGDSVAELDSAPADAAADGGLPGWDETATKLDLAKAYIDMGDAEGARSILDEVMAEGNDNQKQQARSLAAQIAA
jgi:pilus assembly protein FimV